MPPIRMKKSYFDDLGLLRHIEKPARPPQPLFRRCVLVNEPPGGATSESEGTKLADKGTNRSRKR